MLNKFIKTADTGIFIGRIIDNIPHQHYPIQIAIALNKTITISALNIIHNDITLTVKPLIKHQLHDCDENILLIFINPASRLGHTINQHILKHDIQNFSNEWTENIRILGLKWSNGEIDKHSFLSQYVQATQSYFSNCTYPKHYSDKRILNALEILEEHSNEVLSLENIARTVCLSPSRFIHLFKTETGITYRRMQLWIKLMKSFDQLQQVSNITELAYASGFSDSPHYSRTFKETFGIKASVILKENLKK